MVKTMHLVSRMFHCDSYGGELYGEGGYKVSECVKM